MSTSTMDNIRSNHQQTGAVGRDEAVYDGKDCLTRDYDANICWTKKVVASIPFQSAERGRKDKTLHDTRLMGNVVKTERCVRTKEKELSC